jgi:hypothetical protein
VEELAFSLAQMGNSELGYLPQGSDVVWASKYPRTLSGGPSIRWEDANARVWFSPFDLSALFQIFDRSWCSCAVLSGRSVGLAHISLRGTVIGAVRL